MNNNVGMAGRVRQYMYSLIIRYDRALARDEELVQKMVTTQMREVCDWYRSRMDNPDTPRNHITWMDNVYGGAVAAMNSRIRAFESTD
jgi:hypothetical protein